MITLADLVQLFNNGNNAIPVAIEKVENNNGTALKFADGTMICYGKKTINIVINGAAEGGGYMSTYTNYIYFPQQFIEPPNVQLQILGHIAFPTMKDVMGASVTIALKSISSIQTADDYTIQYQAIGKWK